MSWKWTEPANDPFWTQHPRILATRAIEFVPTADMTPNERLNAVARFALYAGVLLILYTGDSWPLFPALGGVIFTIFLFRFGPEPPARPTGVPTEHPGPDSPNPFVPSDQPACIPSTKNNPFGNVLQQEYIDNPTRPPACDYDANREQVERNWSYNLYRDVGEAIWDRNNSQRQFYRMPWTTIPNDQGAFANWLYKTGPVCKTDQTACLRYEDVRQGSRVVGDSEYLA